MKRITSGFVLLSTALIFGMTACTPSKEDAPPKPKVGADASEQKTSSSATASVAALPRLGAAPAWQAQDINGRVIGSEQLKGKVVVVDFWATWCGPCRVEIPGYVELQKKYGKDGFTVVGVSLDQAGPDVVKSFVTKNAVSYPIVMGDDVLISAFGGVEVLPTTFLIDRDGQIRDRKEGAMETAEYEQKILAVLNQG